MEKRQEKRHKVVADELRAFCCWVNAIVLNSVGDSVDVRVELGQERNVKFVRCEAEGLIELLDVVGAVVRRESDPGKNDLTTGMKERGDDGIEVALRVRDGQAAETVVAPELYNDDGGMQAEDFGEAVDAILGGVAADAKVHNSVMVAAVVEAGLEVVGPGAAGFDAVTGGDAVSKTNDDGNGTAGRGV